MDLESCVAKPDRHGLATVVAVVGNENGPRSRDVRVLRTRGLTV
jgi:hypothetical protein